MAEKILAHFPPILAPTEEDIQKMLACNVHVGTRNLDPAMEPYIWNRRSDGVFIINLQRTWEKLMLAARVIVAIENPQDVYAVSARPYGQRAVLKFASFTDSLSGVGRFVPGTFTNQIQPLFVEPRLIVATDPRTDCQPIRESSYANIPVIAFAHTDSPLRHVDIAIPCNNKAKNAIGLMWWFLTREVMYLRGTKVTREKGFDTMVDVFFYRDPDEQNKQEQEAANAYDNTYYEGGDQEAQWGAGESTNWEGAGQGTAEWSTGGDWNSEGQAAAAAAGAPAGSAPAGSWDNSVVGAVTDWANAS